MRKVSDDVKNKTFAPVYLIFGEEAYLRENYKNSLIKALVTPGDNLNYASFAGSGTDPDEVLSLAMTMPFMADKRVIYVKDSGFFKKTCDQIADYIESPSQDTVLIFDESDVDKRGRAYKTAKKGGYDAEAARYDDKKLPGWVAANFNRFDKKVSRDTVMLLIERAGKDMTTLDMEIRKLASYAGDREAVTSDDVLMLTSRSPEFTVYQMIDAIADRKLNKAVGIYYDMLAEKQSPYGILALIERQFRIMISVSDMNARKAPQDEIASAVGVQGWTVNKYSTQTRKFSRQRMIRVLDECVRADREIKQGKIGDNVAVELLIINTARE